MQPNACAVKKVTEDMTAIKGELEEGSKSQKLKNGLPSEILAIMLPAFQVGGLTGLSGLFVGSFAGVVRSSTPKLFALASGIQWFTLGTAFWASRGFVLHAWGNENITPRDRISASAIAGGFSGMAGGSLRGPRNIIPGAIMFSLFGAGGQAFHNRVDAKVPVPVDVAESKKVSWLDSKWSPVKVLSDQEYEEMLREKLLKINAQIALVDESIEAVKQEEQSRIATEAVELSKSK